MLSSQMYTAALLDAEERMQVQVENGSGCLVADTNPSRFSLARRCLCMVLRFALSSRTRVR